MRDLTTIYRIFLQSRKLRRPVESGGKWTMEAATRVTGTHKEKRKQKRGKRRNLLSPERRKREREESDTVVLLQSKENASLEHCQQHLLIPRPRAGTKSYYIISRTKNEPLPESSFHPTLLAFESLLGLGRRNRWLIGPLWGPLQYVGEKKEKNEANDPTHEIAATTSVRFF